MVAARHLATMGVDVTVCTTRPGVDLRGVPAHQLDILERMGVTVAVGAVTTSAAVAVDAVIGYSLNGAPRGVAAELIDAVNGHDAVVALDAPSGLDTTAGSTPGAAVEAGATLTLAMPKVGLRGRPEVGRLFVGDISVPPSVYREMGGPPPAGLFAAGPVVEVV